MKHTGALWNQDMVPELFRVNRPYSEKTMTDHPRIWTHCIVILKLRTLTNFFLSIVLDGVKNVLSKLARMDVAVTGNDKTGDE